MKVLIVKTSSMGDVIHTFPALQDAVEARPELRFDWVVEEGFRPIVALHPAVGHIHPVAIRRWRKALFSGSTWHEARQLRRDFRSAGYDLVIDAQGLLKSALTAKAAGAPVAGYDSESIKERAASLAYDKRFAVPRDLHAIERNRRLFGAALGYRPDLVRLDFGLSLREQGAAGGRRVFLLHGTSRADKKWPAANWVETARLLSNGGFVPTTTFSNEDERCVAEAIRSAVPSTTVILKSGLDKIAAAIRECAGVIGADTGLMHLAAAFGLPTVAIFLVTQPGLTGPKGESVSTLNATPGVPVTAADAVRELERLISENALSRI